MPHILIVCTANICRSPMAEVFLHQALVEKGLSAAWRVSSAGTWAQDGLPASDHGIKVMAERGLDTSQHLSREVNAAMLADVDLVLTMTQGQRQAIVDHWPEVAERVKLVCGDRDVADPIGGPVELYRRCAKQINGGLAEHLGSIDFDSIRQMKIDKGS